jgi:tripartite-type tricarboxylate transporter receptor subunit TctC
MLTRRTLSMMATAAALMPATTRAQQPWPNKTVRVVLGSAPGSSVDIPVRAVCQRLSERFGVPFVIENKVGAAGTIAAEQVLRSPADGYTLLIGTNGELVNGYFMWRNAGRPFPYDPVKDFVPVALVQRGAGLLVVRPDLGVSTLAELIAKAKAEPGKLTVGAGGVGSTVHLVAELFNREAGIDTLIVQFRGSPATILALRSSTIDMMFATPFEIADMVSRKEVLALAVSHTQRIPLFPDVPTFAELGLPNVINLPFVSFCVRKGTPDEVVRTLNKVVIEEIAGGPGKPTLTSPGRESPPFSPDELSAFIADERRRWGDIIVKADIRT